MTFTDEEIEIIRELIYDHGFEYGIQSNMADILKLAEKLGMVKYVEAYKII